MMVFSKRHTRRRKCKRRQQEESPVYRWERLYQAEVNWHVFNGSPRPMRDRLIEVGDRMVKSINDRIEKELAELVSNGDECSEWRLPENWRSLRTESRSSD